MDIERINDTLVEDLRYWLTATAQTGLTGNKTGSFNIVTSGLGDFGTIQGGSSNQFAIDSSGYLTHTGALYITPTGSPATVYLPNNGRILCNGAGELVLGNTDSGTFRMGGTGGNESVLSAIDNNLVYQWSRSSTDNLQGMMIRGVRAAALGGEVQNYLYLYGHDTITANSAKAELYVPTTVKVTQDNSAIDVRTVGNSAVLDIQNWGQIANSYAMLRFRNWAGTVGSAITSDDGTYIQSIAIGNNNMDMVFGNYNSGAVVNEILRLKNNKDVVVNKRIIVPTENDAGTPEVGFGDADTGFFESSDDVLNIATAGALRWSIDASVITSQVTGGARITRLNGDATYATYQFNDDNDTGMFRAGANILGFTTGGVERVRIDSAGILQLTNAIYLTQTDGNEYIDSLNDGYVDIGATTGIRLRQATAIGDGGTTNYTNFAADGELTQFGTARTKKEFQIIATSFSPGASGATEVNVGNYHGWSFGINDDVIISFEVPHDWDSSTNIELVIYWAINEAYATGSGEVQWRARWSATPVGETEAINAPTHTGTIDYGDQDIPATAYYLTSSSAGVISSASLTAGDLIGVTLDRVALDDGSNPVAEPLVVHIEVHYTSNKFGEAL